MVMAAFPHLLFCNGEKLGKRQDKHQCIRSNKLALLMEIRRDVAQYLLEESGVEEVASTCPAYPWGTLKQHGETFGKLASMAVKPLVGRLKIVAGRNATKTRVACKS
jgi:hypothetical protein